MVTWSQNEPSESRKNTVEKYTEESNGFALFFIASWFNLIQLTINDEKVNKLFKYVLFFSQNLIFFIVLDWANLQ